MTNTPHEPSEHEAVDRIAEKLHEAVDKAAAGIGAAEQRTRRQAAEAFETVREGKEYVQVHGEDLLATATIYIRENPLTAVGVAFVAGCIFSLSRRRR